MITKLMYTIYNILRRKKGMVRDDLVAEISMRCDIPMEDVEEVLEEEDIILYEQEKCRKRKKRMCIFSMIIVFIAGVAAAAICLDRKDKISLAEIEDMIKSNVKKYADKIKA